MTPTAPRFLSAPHDRRQLLLWIALALGVGEFVDAFFISFWEGAAVFSALFLAGAWWLKRGRVGGVILVGALCLFELLSFPTWHRSGTGDWISQITFVTVAAAGFFVALAVLRQAHTTRKTTATPVTREA